MRSMNCESASTYSALGLIQLRLTFASCTALVMYALMRWLKSSSSASSNFPLVRARGAAPTRV